VRDDERLFNWALYLLAALFLALLFTGNLGA